MFAKASRCFIIRRMKSAPWIFAACALSLCFTSCGTGGNRNPSPGTTGTGPFDSRGNYVEEWADNPTKWKRPGSSPSQPKPTEDVPQIAQNDQPPMNSVPLATGRSPEPKPIIKETSVVAKNTVSKSEPERVVVKTRPLTKPEAEVVRAKPKPKVVVKAKPKPKPKPTRYVVKQGDSLSAIASRNGTSVSALKSENGISGTLIRPGQSLTIPKR